MTSSSLDLQQAADRLGVHYQTAYKWVRSGRLPATLVAGRYTLDPADVEAFDARRNQPSPPPARRPRSGFDELGDRVHELLVQGAEADVRKLIGTLVEQGIGMTALLDDVISPALRRIGAAWHDGEQPVWIEHRATGIVERLIGEHHPNPRGRRRGTAVVAAVSDERHALPTSMAAVALREDNWRVHHLGADMPPADIAGLCVELPADLLVLSVANPDAHPLAERVAADLEGRVPTLVGHPNATLQDLVARARETRSR